MQAVKRPLVKQSHQSWVGGAFQVGQDDPRVLDLVHLSCQTFGDINLEREVLQLFRTQASSLSRVLSHTDDSSERKRLYHLLKGSARGVGAMLVAQAAHEGEASPGCQDCRQRTLRALDDVIGQIDGLLAGSR